MKIGIIGNGFVGKATRVLECNDIDIYSYDINPDLCIPHGITLKDLVKRCSIIFVSVPTPMNSDGSCYLNIVENVVSDIKKIDENKCIVIRSTVPVGTADRLGCYFMPEFLTEANFINDFVNCEKWIFGYLEGINEMKRIEFECRIKNLFTLAFFNGKIKSKECVFLPNKSAEMVKLFRNCFLATKVGFCNEMEEFCSKVGVNYNQMVAVAAEDKRIGLSHIRVPGPDGHRGFGGTCFPKDMASLEYQLKNSSSSSFIVSAVVERNNKQDRPEQDWNNDKGRAVSGQ